MAEDGKVRIIVITNAESVAKQFEKLDKSIENTTKSTEKLDTTTKPINSTFKNLVKNTEDIKNQLRDLAIAGQQDTEAFKKLREELTQNQSLLKIAGDSTKDFSKNLDKTEKSAKKLDSTSKLLQSTIKSLIAILSVRQIIRFGNELKNTTLKLEALDRKLIASSGSVELAQQSYKFVSEEVDRLGLSLESALDGFAGFSASALRSGLTFEETKQIFSDVSSALVVLNADSVKTESVFRALEQISSKGKLSLEELSGQLGDALPAALATAAVSLGKSREELFRLVSTGKIASDEFLPVFAKAIKQTLGSNVEQASQSARANFNRLNNSILLLKDSLGQELVPELVNFANEIRSFIDDEGTKIVKIFAILIDTVQLLSKTLIIAGKISSLRIRDLPQDFLELKIIIEEFGKTIGDTEERLKNLKDTGKGVNDNLKLSPEVKKGFKDFLEELITIEDIAKTIGNNLADALTTPFKKGESAGERFKKVMLEIFREISRQLIATGITKGIISAFGGSTGITPVPSAKGNVFANGNIKPFANGGVINQPTLFPMQNGAGLMGEAGAEAILPLKRGKDGKLGVETSERAGGNINIFNQTDSKIEVVRRPNNERDIFIRNVNSALTSERTKGAFGSALQSQQLSGVQAS